MNAYLITGGAGYIGSHLAEKLIKLKKKVIIYDNLSTGSKRLVDNKAVFINGDINNFIKVSKTIKKYNVKTVFHFAASINVSEAERNKKKYYKNNILGTKNLLKGIEKSNNNVNKFIFASSASIYGDTKNVKVSENFVQNPKHYYAYTKYIGEKMIEKYCKNNDINFLSIYNQFTSENKKDFIFKNFIYGDIHWNLNGTKLVNEKLIKSIIF